MAGIGGLNIGGSASKTTKVYNTTTVATPGDVIIGGGGEPITSSNLLSGTFSVGGNITMSDQGAVGAAFDFAKNVNQTNASKIESALNNTTELAFASLAQAERARTGESPSTGLMIMVLAAVALGAFFLIRK